MTQFDKIIMSFAYIYAKKDKIKALTLDERNKQHDQLISENWVHTNIIQPFRCIEYFHNELDSIDINREIKLLSKNKQP